MYTVQWCDETGTLRQLPLQTLEDAKLEAADLKEKYGWAEILDPNSNVIEM